jgi:hypothetical protein
VVGGDVAGTDLLYGLDAFAHDAPTVVGSKHSTNDLDAVAAALNTRPRKTLGWKTPAEALNDYLLATPKMSTNRRGAASRGPFLVADSGRHSSGVKVGSPRCGDSTLTPSSTTTGRGKERGMDKIALRNRPVCIGSTPNITYS